MRSLGPVCLLLMLISPGSQALDFYTELNANAHLTDISTQDFTTANVEVRLGAYFQQNVGIELHASTAVSDDEKLDLLVEVPYSAGAALRFQSPERDGARVLILLGYAVSELALDRSGTGEPGEDEFDGFTYGGGFEFRPGMQKNWFLNVKMQRYYKEKDIELDAASIGVRYQF